jgi:hypothetical protein
MIQTFNKEIPQEFLCSGEEEFSRCLLPWSETEGLLLSDVWWESKFLAYCEAPSKLMRAWMYVLVVIYV